MKRITKVLLSIISCCLLLQGCAKTEFGTVSVLPHELDPLRDALSQLSQSLELVGTCEATYESVLQDLQRVNNEFAKVKAEHPNLIPRKEEFEKRFENLESEAQYIMSACKGDIYVTPALITEDHLGGALGEWRARIDFISDRLNAALPELRPIEQGSLTNTLITAETAVGTTFQDCSDGFCPVMTVVPAGTFMMGATEEQLDLFNVAEDRRHWELPRREVTISRPFAVGIHEVTLESFKRFVEETGEDVLAGCRTYLPNGDPTGQTFRPNISYQDIGFPMPQNGPVSCITKENAIAYTKWLSQKTNQTYRLPTEAEWEFFARAGTQTAYYWGDEQTFATDYANVYDQSSWLANNFAASGVAFTPFPGDDGNAYQATVGSYIPNAYGIYDVSGNVREWVEDVWVEDPQGNYTGAPTDGSARKDGLTLFGLSRGGAWYYQAATIRTTYRNAYVSSEMRGVTWGFRVVRDI